MQTAKHSAQQLLNALPNHVTWDEIMYEFYVKESIENGLLDIKKGDVFSHEQLKMELLNDENLMVNAIKLGCADVRKRINNA